MSVAFFNGALLDRKLIEQTGQSITVLAAAVKLQPNAGIDAAALSAFFTAQPSHA
jgi:hypothetical protein